MIIAALKNKLVIFQNENAIRKVAIAPRQTGLARPQSKIAARQIEFGCRTHPFAVCQNQFATMKIKKVPFPMKIPALKIEFSR